MPKEMSEEDIAALQEKIKDMSPEELKEFQKKQCIFCHIVAGKVQAKKIYEDEKTLAVLDINPANPGHILLLPKEHYAVMPQIPEDELTHLFMVAKSLSNVALKSLEATGTNIIVANGPAAGQKAQHFMIHIIPRKEKDNLSFDVPQQNISEKDLDVVQEKLSKKISSMLGKKPQAKQETPAVIKKLSELKKKDKVVEAEFKEKPRKKEKSAKKSLKNAVRAKKEVKKKDQKKKEVKEEGVNLDDIASVLGVK